MNRPLLFAIILYYSINQVILWNGLWISQFFVTSINVFCDITKSITSIRFVIDLWYKKIAMNLGMKSNLWYHWALVKFKVQCTCLACCIWPRVPKKSSYYRDTLPEKVVMHAFSHAGTHASEMWTCLLFNSVKIFKQQQQQHTHTFLSSPDFYGLVISKFNEFQSS